MTVSKGQKEAPVQPGAKAPKPSLDFAMPTPQPRTEGRPETSQLATEGRAGQPGEGQWQAESERVPTMGQGVDTRAVADRVYELMKQELALSRERSGLGRKA